MHTWPEQQIFVSYKKWVIQIKMIRGQTYPFGSIINSINFRVTLICVLMTHVNKSKKERAVWHQISRVENDSFSPNVTWKPFPFFVCSSKKKTQLFHIMIQWIQPKWGPHFTPHKSLVEEGCESDRSLQSFTVFANIKGYCHHFFPLKWHHSVFI